MRYKLLLAAFGAAFFMAEPAMAQTAGTVTANAFAVGQGAGKTGFASVLCTQAQIAIGQSAANPICQSLTGDVTINASGVTAIGSAKVTSAMLRNSGALSLMGRSVNSSGVPGDISAVAASSCAFIESGSTIICGQLATAGLANNAVTDAKLRQGLARSVIGVAGNATANVTDIQGTANQALIVNSAGTGLGFGQVNLTSSAAVTGTLPLANGGTGDTGTAWASFTPSPSCGTASIATTSARSKTLGKTMWLEFDFTITSIGTCTQTLTFALPSVTAQSGGAIFGREYGVSGKGFVCDVRASSATATCSLSDFSALASGAHIVASGVFEIQ
jgi:hypothetical protein